LNRKNNRSERHKRDIERNVELQNSAEIQDKEEMIAKAERTAEKVNKEITRQIQDKELVKVKEELEKQKLALEKRYEKEEPKIRQKEIGFKIAFDEQIENCLLKRKKLDEGINRLKKSIDRNEEESIDQKKSLECMIKDRDEIISNIREIAYKFIHSKKTKVVLPTYRRKKNAKPITAILDASAVIDLLDDFTAIHSIKNCARYNFVKFIFATEVEHESRLSCYPKEWIKSEMNALFGENIIFLGHEMMKNFKTLIIKKNYDLSTVDAQLLVYAKSESAVLITSDRELKFACMQEGVEVFDQREEHDPYWQENKTTNFEDWIFGKISRMGNYWREINDLRVIDKNEYLEKMEEFKLYLSQLFRYNNKFKFFVIPLWYEFGYIGKYWCGKCQFKIVGKFPGNELSKTIENFFATIIQEPPSTLEDIFNVLTKIFSSTLLMSPYRQDKKCRP